MSAEALPEYDRAPGAPHPRETLQLYGQHRAEAAFLEAYNSGRMHHGWLVTGPKGVGKATLAWRIARFLLTQPPPGDAGLFGAPPAPANLDAPVDHPVTRRMASLSEPGLFLLRTVWDEEKKRFKQGITVDEARKLKGFFQLSATDGGRRVVIVDAADEMNPNAANALLKLLEEPPANAVLLLIAHQPNRLLPTIRSRCRELRCSSLPAPDLDAALSAAGLSAGDDPTALAELAGGSVGQAIRLIEHDGVKTYGALITLFSGLPNVDRQQALAIAESFGARGQGEKFALLLDLIDLFLARVARAGVVGATQSTFPNEAKLFQRLATDPWRARRWAELQQELGQRARRGNAVNLDPSALILDIVLRINQAAANMAA